MDNGFRIITYGFFLLFLTGILCGAPVCAFNIMVFEQSDRTAPVPQALIYSDGEYTATTDENGTYNLSYEGVPPKLRIAKAGYREWTGVPSINDTLILVPLQVRNCTYLVQVFDADTLLPVEGAQVKAGYGDKIVQQGRSSINGTVLLPLRTEQVYDLMVTSPNYQVIREKLITGFEDSTVQYSLIRNDRISLLVKDTPDGRIIPDAVISIDSQTSGKTNEKGIFITNLSRGVDHTIEVTANGYERTIMQKTPGEDDLIIDLTLVRQKSPVFITVYNEQKNPVEHAEIRIDGNQTGFTNQYGRLTIPDLALRKYDFEVFKEGYETQKYSQAVSAGESDIIFDIRPEKVRILVQVEDLSGLPLGNASVLVNGSVAGLADSNGTLQILLEKGKSCQISASIPGYFENNTTVIPPITSPLLIILEPEKPVVTDTPFPWLTTIIGIGGAAGILVLIFYIRGGGKKPSRSQKKRISLRKRSL